MFNFGVRIDRCFDRYGLIEQAWIKRKFCLKLNKIKLLRLEAKHKNLKPPSLTINDKSDERCNVL